MTGIVTGQKWNYHLHIDDEQRSKKVYWRNGGRPWIKVQTQWVPVFFNRDLVAEQGFVKMEYGPDGWEMAPEEIPKARELALR